MLIVSCCSVFTYDAFESSKMSCFILKINLTKILKFSENLSFLSYVECFYRSTPKQKKE